MGAKAIKVSESTYSVLRQRAEERGTSIKAVVDELVRDEDIADYAGAWTMTDEEAEDIRSARERLWAGWTL
ncbi:MAG: hypothetical protein SVU88_04440 [Candidatus Nanohaloarchaea archaeon]|nr:hypothetical protein [Candidatus Nanohaloarchaea archaeon]